ncbi:hypothetical protein INT45_002568, partial [Circinella minor]
IQRIISNHAIVPPGRDVDFIDYTDQMYNAAGEKSYNWAVQQICNDYPNTKKWLDWWTRNEIAGMIFKLKGWLKDELQNHPCRTSNGVEALHRDLYHIVEKKKPVIETLHQIFSYLRSSGLDLEFVDAGGRVDYNRKKTGKQRQMKKFFNDGHAPDMTKTLLDYSFKSNAGRKKKMNNEGEENNKSESKDEQKATIEEENEKKIEEEKAKKVAEEKAKKIEEENAKKKAAEERRRRAEKHAGRIEENKKRTKQESKKRKLNDSSNFAREMHNAQMFRHLGLLAITPDILTGCQLDVDDVLGLYNPKGDGHCGWRASSVLLYNNEEHYNIVKELMRHTLLAYKEHYKRMLRKDDYEEKLATLSHTGRIAGQRFWFDVLDCPRLLAEAYNRPVILYMVSYDPNIKNKSFNGVTFLPIFSECRQCNSNDKNMGNSAPIVLFLNGNHFQLIVIKDEAIDRVI